MKINLSVDGFAAVSSLVDDLCVGTGEDAETVFGRHGTLGRDVAPVEAPHHLGRRRPDGRAIDGKRCAQIDHHHRRWRDQDRWFGCNKSEHTLQSSPNFIPTCADLSKEN